MSNASSIVGPSRVALVTGGAIRIGRAIVEHLVRDGYRVWIHCRTSHEEASALARALGDRCLGVLNADLADESDRDAIAGRVLDATGPASGQLSLLVNNAASFERGSFLQRSDADLRRVLETNLVAPIALARRLAPALAATEGAVINIVDAAGYHPWRGYLDHCTAKAGLLMATRALALELAPTIRVNGIAPGTVAWPTDPLYAEGSAHREAILASIPLGRIGDPADIARAVVFLAVQPHITGQTLAVDGGQLANVGR